MGTSMVGCVRLTPELSCVARLPARTQPFYRSYCPFPVLERAEMQVCHVSYSALLGIYFHRSICQSFAKGISASFDIWIKRDFLAFLNIVLIKSSRLSRVLSANMI